MRLLIAIVAVGAIGITAALGTALLGLVDVGATTPHWKITRWLLSTTMESAVQRRAAGIRVPDGLSDAGRVRAGAAAYDEMCVSCHAAPGVEGGAIARGLRPEPPVLHEEAHEWSAAELYWIIEHGVRMTGMPAFGPTHGEPELWALVAFLRRLPELSAAEYRALSVRGEAEPGQGEAHGDAPVDHAH